MSEFEALCVYCGSRPGARASYVEGARELGHLLAERDIRLVYGAGSVGMMGEIADAVLDRGGKVTGIIPSGLHHKEGTHMGVTDLHVVSSMHERKAMMEEASDGLIAMPGGYGTLDELFETLTWAQLGIHKKPVGLLNIDGYWDPMLAMVDHMNKEGFLADGLRELIIDATAPAALLEAMAEFTPPKETIWRTSAEVKP